MQSCRSVCAGGNFRRARTGERKLAAADFDGACSLKRSGSTIRGRSSGMANTTGRFYGFLPPDSASSSQPHPSEGLDLAMLLIGFADCHSAKNEPQNGPVAAVGDAELPPRETLARPPFPIAPSLTEPAGATSAIGTPRPGEAGRGGSSESKASRSRRGCPR
jgi:hypothetical protein